MRGRSGWRLKTKRPSSLAPGLKLAAPARPGSLRAVPAPGAPKGRGGRLRLGQRSGAGRFRRNLPLLFSLWAKKEDLIPPHKQTFPISILLAPERWEDLSEEENLSEFVDPLGQQPAPTPTPGSNDPQPRAFRKASPLAGGKEGRSGFADGPSTTAACGGRFLLYTRFAKFSHRIPSCPARGKGAGKN